MIGEPVVSCKSADPLLRDPEIEQRGEDVLLGGRRSAGTIITGVIGVRAVEHGRKSALIGQPAQA